MSAYDAELRLLDEQFAKEAPDDVVTATARASGGYQRASLTGDLAALRPVEAAIGAALERFGPWPDLCVVKASVAATLHRTADARAALLLAPGVTDHLPGRAMLADLAREEGRYEEALAGFEAALEDEPAWDVFARLADLTYALGAPDQADDLYARAVDELTAKQLRSYAWVELQWGRMQVRRGLLDSAADHYARAHAAFSGYWLLDQHVAELLAARGELRAAAELYESVCARVPKPEVRQALGMLYAKLGDPRAQERLDEALAAFLDSAARGEVHYLHHLAEFYLEEDPAEAVRWARRDAELRPNAMTQSLLAWALFRAGEVAEASAAIAPALASGLQSPLLFERAAAIGLPKLLR